MTSVDPRRTQPFCTPRCYRECRCSRWPGYLNRFGWPVIPSGEVAYYEKVLSYSPIAYWPLWETAGVVAECLVNPAQNGTYSADVSGWPPGTGIGDGNTAPYFDGANDYINLFSATLAAAWNKAEGTIACWAKVGAAGDWTDGTANYIVNWQTDGNNCIRQYKDAVNNRFTQYYAANANVEMYQRNGESTTDWFLTGITWSVTANEVRHYWNGAWQETDVALGVWVGALAKVILGSYNIPVNQPWHGWLAHFMVFDTPLTDADMLDLATV